jgi:hypothetical protein
LDWTPKAHVAEGKIDNTDFMKIKTCALKDIIFEMKR